MRRLALCVCLAVTACAGRTRAQDTASHMTAARIYGLAEQHVSDGRYPEAVGLIRHALLQLPERADADALRHKLLLRLAYVQMLAYHRTGERAFVEDAQRMLERYLVRHEALFGEGKKAAAERGDVYAILYEVETLREAPEIEAAPTRAAVEREPEPEPTVAQEAAVDTHAGEDVESEMQREVHVHTRGKLAQPDDPRVRERLESAFSNAEIASVLTAGGVALVHGPRPLVRAHGHASAVGPESADADKLARRLGHALLMAARPALRRCYEGSFSRNAVAVTDGIVEASIHPDGSVTKVRIVEGGLDDALGDVCLVEQIEAARIAVDDTRHTVRVRVPLLFFYEGPVYIHEGNGDQFQLAPIDRFAR